MVRPVSGMTPGDAADDDEALQRHEKDRPTASSLPKPSRTPSAVRRPRSTIRRVEQQQREEPDQAELLAEGSGR